MRQWPNYLFRYESWTSSFFLQQILRSDRNSIFPLPIKKLAFFDNNDVVSLKWKETQIQKTIFRTRRNLEHSFMSKWLRKRLILTRQNARIGLGPINLFLRFLLCYPGQHRKRRKRTTLTTSPCFTYHPFNTFETKRQLEPKCVSQMLLGSPVSY